MKLTRRFIHLSLGPALVGKSKIHCRVAKASMSVCRSDFDPREGDDTWMRVLLKEPQGLGLSSDKGDAARGNRKVENDEKFKEKLSKYFEDVLQKG